MKKNTLDIQIAAAKTHAEKKRIVALNGAKRPTRVQILAHDWRLVVYWRDHPEKRPPYYAESYNRAVQAGSDFARDAFLKGDFKMVAELAKEIKRPTWPKREPIDARRWDLLRTIDPNPPKGEKENNRIIQIETVGDVARKHGAGTFENKKRALQTIRKKWKGVTVKEKSAR